MIRSFYFFVRKQHLPLQPYLGTKPDRPFCCLNGREDISVISAGCEQGKAAVWPQSQHHQSSGGTGLLGCSFGLYTPDSPQLHPMHTAAGGSLGQSFVSRISTDPKAFETGTGLKRVIIMFDRTWVENERLLKEWESTKERNNGNNWMH